MVKTLQPNSNYCFVCGLKNADGLKLRFHIFENGEIRADCNLPEKFQGYPGVVHGGIVAAMLDETACRSHMVKIDDDGNLSTRFLVTVRLDIRYRKNVPVGQSLHLIGQPGKTRGNSAQAKAFIFDESGILLAEAEAILMDVPDDVLVGLDLEELGWEIAPEGEVM